jgi:hypothetical protein
VFELSPKKLDPKAAAKKPVARTKWKKTNKGAGRTGGVKTAGKTPALVPAAKSGASTPGAGTKKPAQSVAPAAGNAAIAKPSPAIVKTQANPAPN